MSSESELLEQIRALLQRQDHEAAVRLLIEKQQLLRSGDPGMVLHLLRLLPLWTVQGSAQLLWLQGWAEARTGSYAAAAASLENARLDLIAQRQQTDALRVVLELARLHHLLEDLGMARLYTQMASDLLRELHLGDPGVEAEAVLRVAMLAPDIGLYREGEDLARRALRLYELQGDRAGVCSVWLLLFSFHNQTGRYQASGSYLRQAQQLVDSANLGPVYAVSVLNKRAHWYWYQGNLAAGLKQALAAVELADASAQPKWQVYNRLVVGNLARAMGDSRTALRWYMETERLAKSTGFERFVCWIDINWAWLEILQERYEPARERIHRVLQTHDRGQAMSFSVFLAVLYSLTGRIQEAVDLLQRSLIFYQESHDLLSTCSIRLQLAACFLANGQREQAEALLAQALRWMAEQRIDYLPHWWHPATMVRLCIHALEQGLAPGTAEQILVEHLGDLASEAVLPLLQKDNPAVCQRAVDILERLERGPLAVLGTIHEPRVRAVLSELLAMRRLRASALPKLAERLTGSGQSRRPNPTLLAVFGLYLYGATRQEIALRLHISSNVVRNYINQIYQAFRLSYQASQRDERRRQLWDLAQQAGYVETPSEPGSAAR
jgi:tetratricopeptide (TPR) repeat protein